MSACPNLIRFECPYSQVISPGKGGRAFRKRLISGRAGAQLEGTVGAPPSLQIRSLRGSRNHPRLHRTGSGTPEMEQNGAGGPPLLPLPSLLLRGRFRPHHHRYHSGSFGSAD